MAAAIAARHVNPFLSAAYDVIEAILAEKAGLGRVAALPGLFTTQQCNAVTGITGHLEGHAIYGMRLGTADRLASAMIGQPIVTFDNLAASAIAEFANMITGHAMTLLAEEGFVCDITPPSIIRGTNVNITSLVKPVLSVPICCSIGEIELNICLRERNR